MLRVLQHEANFLHRLGRYILQFDLSSSSDLLLNFTSVDMVDLIEHMLPSFRLQEPKRDFVQNGASNGNGTINLNHHLGTTGAEV
jgi:hypothetical protein